MKKRILAILMTLCLVVGMMPTVALAAETGTETANAIQLPEAVNGVITLTGDVNLTEAYAISADTTVKIDLDGHTLTGASGTYGYTINNSGTLEIVDSGATKGKIVGQATSSACVRNNGTLTMNGVTVESAFIAVKNEDIGNLTMTGCMLTSTYQDANTGTLMNWGTASVSDSTITASDKGAAIYATSGDTTEGATQKDSTITLTNCTLSGKYAVYAKKYSSSSTKTQIVNIVGGNLSAKASTGLNFDAKSTVSVSGNVSADANTAKQALKYATSGTTVTLTENVSDSDITVPEGVTLNLSQGVTVSPGEKHKVVVNGTLAGEGSVDAVAYNENKKTYYGYLPKATKTSGASDGDTIKLLTDVTLTEQLPVQKSITLDLNEKVLTSSYNGYAVKVSNNKSLTLKNGELKNTVAGGVEVGHSSMITVEQDATITTTGTGLRSTPYDASSQPSPGNVTFNVHGTLNSKNVGILGNGTKNTFNVDGATINSDYYGVFQNGSYGGAKITIKDSTVTDTKCAAVYVSNSSINANNANQGMQTLTIENSVITGPTGVEVKYTDVTISGNSTKVTGNGTPVGETLNDNGSVSTGYALAATHNGMETSADATRGTLTISGGQFTGEIGIQAASADFTDDDVHPATISISGGTFSTNPSDYVAQNYIVRKDSDTSYTVVAKENLTSGVYMSDPSSSVASGYVVSGSGDGPYTVSVYIPTTTTTTTTNDDGSKTTTTTDKSTGATTETTTSQPVTDEAGNTTQTTTETVTQKDGSTTETVTETVKAADGSTTETVTETATNKDGATTSTTETVTTTDTAGTTATKVTETDAAGETSTTVEATVSTQAVTQAAETDTAVTIPVAVTAVKAEDSESAAVVTVNVPSAVTEENTVKVEIPVENLTTGTVAVVVNADGTEEIVKTSTLGEEGVVLTLEGDATVKIVDNSKIFEDVHPVDHWAEDAVTYVAAREMFEGTGNNNFSPDEDLNRAMLMTVLARYDGEDTTGGETWYEQGMNWAMQTGVSDGSDPEVSITREQMVTMIWRYAGKPESNHALDFNDAHDINDWAEEAMRWAVSTGIINGVGNNTLDPKGPATRAQVATVMMRFCENIAK